MRKILYFVRKHIWKKLVCIVIFLLQFFRMVGYWNCSNKSSTSIQMCIGLADAVLQPKIVGNRLDILTQILIAMYYSISFFIYISEKYLQFRKEQKHLLRKNFGPPHTSNRIYLLCNRFSNYIYLRDMQITLKGIGKVLFISV